MTSLDKEIESLREETKVYIYKANPFGTACVPSSEPILKLVQDGL